MISIKAIAVDMDGTFLNEHHDYNRERFAKLYKKITAEGIKFIVASGRQYHALLPYFKDVAEDITFISDNGTQIIHQGQEVFAKIMTTNQVQMMMDWLYEAGISEFVLSGKKGSYMDVSRISKERLEYLKNFTDNIDTFHTLEEVDDDILKFGVSIKDEIQKEALMDIIKNSGKMYETVVSGFGFMDIIIPGVSKGVALKKFMNAYQIKDDEVIVFGDSDNDIPMLTGKKYSFAMENAADNVKACANYIAPLNREEGVLETIECLLTNKEPFVC